MIVEETARILYEPDTHYSEFERAILLFGLQIAAISPTEPQLALDAPAARDDEDCRRYREDTRQPILVLEGARFRVFIERQQRSE